MPSPVVEHLRLIRVRRVLCRPANPEGERHLPLMKQSLALILAGAGLSLFLARPAPAADQVRQSIPIDADWRFKLGDFAGAEKAVFDDAAWRSLDVPHDWGVEGPFDSLNPAGGAGAFLPAGVGWYRKHFALPADFAGRRIFVEFDGVMANSDVWINDAHLGRRPFGYAGFRYEITQHLKPGDQGPNVLAGRGTNADSTKPELLHAGQVLRR